MFALQLGLIRTLTLNLALQIMVRQKSSPSTFRIKTQSFIILVLIHPHSWTTRLLNWNHHPRVLFRMKWSFYNENSSNSLLVTLWFSCGFFSLCNSKKDFCTFDSLVRKLWLNLLTLQYLNAESASVLNVSLTFTGIMPFYIQRSFTRHLWPTKG